MSALESATRLDRRGRITVRAEYRRILGNRVVQILTPHGVLLRPVPDRLPDRARLPPAHAPEEMMRPSERRAGDGNR